MTVMSAAEARREKHRQQVDNLIPDWEAETEAMMEDLALPPEFEDHGFEDTHEVAEHIEEMVVETIRSARVGADAQTFVEEEVEVAKQRVYDRVMKEFPEYAERNGITLG